MNNTALTIATSMADNNNNHKTEEKGEIQIPPIDIPQWAVYPSFIVVVVFAVWFWNRFVW